MTDDSNGDSPSWVLSDLLVGTACSGVGALAIIIIYLCMPELKKYRMIFHLVFKAVHVLFMVCGESPHIPPTIPFFHFTPVHLLSN